MEACRLKKNLKYPTIEVYLDCEYCGRVLKTKAFTKKFRRWLDVN